MRKKIFSFLILLSASGMSFGQSSYWKKANLIQQKEAGKPAVRADLGDAPAVYSLDTKRIQAVFNKVDQAKGKKVRIEFPDSEGNILSFNVYQTQVMEAELAQKYPNIKTYKGEGITDKESTLYLSVTPLGVNGLIRDVEGNETYIDTYALEHNSYVAYKRGQQNKTADFRCLVKTDEEEVKANQERLKASQEQLKQTTFSNDQVYRTYRLAMACTIEYADFQIKRAGVEQGTLHEKKEAVLAAMVVTVNRVNSIYERDMALHMNLVANNDELIFIEKDNFTNDNANYLIGESQYVIDNVIGFANYDLGHTVSTGGGGLAQLGVPCTNWKAMGITGSPEPIGDPYDVDYVSHEMGHQFGANHTFNNSAGGNVNPYTSYEPGSGSTIMGYAGITSPNVQMNSDSYFHANSILEMQYVIQNRRNCGEETPSQNEVPIVDAGLDYTLPVGTPFVLKGKATGANSDTYTYTWEQFNKEITIQPPLPTAVRGPNFRSLTPSLSPNRYMPVFEDVLEGRIANVWEVVPTVARKMDFNLTVRNFANPFGGQVGMDAMSLTFVGTDPFVITGLGTVNEEGATVWEEGTQEVIEWDVSNTAGPEIGTDKVNILFSTDNGATFTTIVEHAANSGHAVIIVPEGITEEGRIMIEPVNNIYYALSDVIEVTPSTGPPVVFEKDVLIVYPNPSAGEFRVRFISESGENVAISLFDIKGNLVYKDIFHSEHYFDQLVSVPNLQGGMYIVKVNDGQVKKEVKIVVK